MPRPRRAPLTLASTVVVLLAAISPRPRAAHAGNLEVVSTRARGLGGALRGAAAGSAAPTMNPSGISLSRSYTIEGAYQHMQDEDGHLAHVALADSTSGSNVGGGVTYTYATGKIGDVARGRHEFGLSLSFPFGDYVSIGATGRYLRLRAEGPAGLEKRTGTTIDAGITIRAGQMLSIGACGYGLRDLKDPQAPLSFGGGIALVPQPELMVAADMVVDPRTYEAGAAKAYSFMGGAEYTWAAKLAVRAGGGHDGLRKSGYGTLGASALGEMGALDVAARLDFGGDGPLFIGASLRIFVPSP